MERRSHGVKKSIATRAVETLFLSSFFNAANSLYRLKCSALPVVVCLDQTGIDAKSPPKNKACPKSLAPGA